MRLSRIVAFDGGWYNLSMKIGPFTFGKKVNADVRCFILEGYDRRSEQDPNLTMDIEAALRDAGVAELGVWSSDNLWCVEDPTGPERARKVFEGFGFKPNLTDPERGKRFHRITVGYNLRDKGDHGESKS